jgi:RHS repeat-associated protein
MRVTKGDGTATTTYSSKYYNISTTGTSTKHVYDNSGTLLATIEGGGTATSTYFIHTDHLGGADIVVDRSGNVVEETDYFPYGAQRVSNQQGQFIEQRKHTGHEFDTESNLTYGEARYRNQDVGKWLSQDPVIIVLADSEQLNAVLNDPQLLNSYAYSRNNPLIFVDRDGEFVQALYAAGAGFVVGVGVEYIGDIVQNRAVEGQRGFASFAPREGFAKRAVVSGLETGVTAGIFAASPLAGIGATPVFSIVGDLAAGEDINIKEAAVKTGTTAVTAGLLKGISGVPGRLPGPGTKSFFFGEHAQRWSLETLIGGVLDAGVNTFTTVESNKNNNGNNNNAQNKKKDDER